MVREAFGNRGYVDRYFALLENSPAFLTLGLCATSNRVPTETTEASLYTLHAASFFARRIPDDAPQTRFCLRRVDAGLNDSVVPEGDSPQRIDFPRVETLGYCQGGLKKSSTATSARNDEMQLQMTRVESR